MDKRVLDACCGTRAFYFDKENANVEFVDIREGDFSCYNRKTIVKPDAIADFRELPYANKSFDLVIFDPPHLTRAGEKSWLRAKYGCLDRNNWQSDLAKGFCECWRVLRHGGTLIFKWSESEIKIKDVLALFDQKPLLGHQTKKSGNTHWLVFFKA